MQVNGNTLNFTVAHSVLTSTSDHEQLSKSLSSVAIKGVNHNVNSLVLIKTYNLTPVFGFIVEIFLEGSIGRIGFIIKVLRTICMYPHIYCYVVDLRKWGQEVVARPKVERNLRTTCII